MLQSMTFQRVRLDLVTVTTAKIVNQERVRNYLLHEILKDKVMGGN